MLLRKGAVEVAEILLSKRAEDMSGWGALAITKVMHLEASLVVESKAGSSASCQHSSSHRGPSARALMTADPVRACCYGWTARELQCDATRRGESGRFS